MLGDYFLETVPKHKIDFFKSFASRKLKGTDFTKSVLDEPKFVFYNEDVKKSKSIKEIKFTNKIANRNTESIKTRLRMLGKNTSVIIKTDGESNDVEINHRVRLCIGLYYPITKEDEGNFAKTDIRDSTGFQLGVRVFTTVKLIEHEGDFKAEYIIVLIDPHHLVIPTGYGGKRVNDVIDETYKLHASQGHCMSRYFDE